MKVTVTLEQADIDKAVNFWLADNGMALIGSADVHVDKGDRPADAERPYIVADAELPDRKGKKS